MVGWLNWLAFIWMVGCAGIWTWVLWHMHREHRNAHEEEIGGEVWAECRLPNGALLYGPVVNRRREGSTLFGDARFVCHGQVDLSAGAKIHVYWNDFLDFEVDAGPQNIQLTAGDTLTVIVSVNITIQQTPRAPVVRPPAAPV